MNNNNSQAADPMAYPAKRRLPMRSITFSPSNALRALILKIALVTNRSPSEVLDDLLVQAAGGKIHWVTVQPRCGEGAGVSLQQVNEALEKIFFMLRDAKGVIARGGSDAQHKIISEVVIKSLELWSHAQSLAETTFYSFEQIQIGRAVYAEMVRAMESAKKQETDEVAKKEKADSKVIEGYRARLEKYQAVVEMLTRLGFSPEGPQNAN